MDIESKTFDSYYDFDCNQKPFGDDILKTPTPFKDTGKAPVFLDTYSCNNC